MAEELMIAYNKPTDAHKAAMQHAVEQPLSVDENKSLRSLIERHVEYLRARSCTGTGSTVFRGIVEYGWRAIPIICAYIDAEWRVLQLIASIVGTSACRTVDDGEYRQGEVRGIVALWSRWLDEVGAP